MKSHQPFRQWYWMPALIVVLGIVSITLLFWVYQTGERQRGKSDFIDAVMDLRVRTATFHLWFEEAITGGTRAEIEKTLVDIDLATDLSRVILDGGVNEDGATLPPLDDPELRKHAEAVRTLLAQFRKVALTRLRNPGSAAIGSPLDEQFDEIFRNIEKKTKIVELLAEKDMVRDQSRSRHLLLGMTITWALIMVASARGIWSRELGMKKAEEALRQAHDELERRVAERTAELTDANRELLLEIASRNKIEEILRASERNFRNLSREFQTIVSAIPDSISLISPDLRVLWTNKDAASAGKTGKAVGQHCCSLWGGASAVCKDCPALSCFQTGKAENTQVSRPDGSIWDIRAFPMKDEDGKIKNSLEIATDVTEKVALQTETMRATHLASIGELAAGVAHEINNPVNGIINYARLLSNRSAGESEEHDIAQRIAKEGRRIAGIVRSLLSFARSDKEEKKPVRVQQILFESLTLTESQMRKEGIQLKVDLSHELPEITANPQQIQQVFMNIISNARHALNRKYPGENEDKILDILCEEILTGKGLFVRTTFHDHGTGIAADVLDRVMNPFFTTKPAGEGTGLGLSISHGIVADHGGRLAIDSVEGEYTKVAVYLPAGERNGQDSGNR